jgi:hypothetical protein
LGVGRRPTPKPQTPLLWECGCPSRVYAIALLSVEPVWHFQKGSWRNPPIGFLIFRDDPSSRLVRFLAKLELFVAQDDAFDQADPNQK